MITGFAICLALLVVMLGAYTRLTNAGLGCPDWPGCYGHLVLPSQQLVLEQAQLHYPHVAIDKRKAWTEMAHRYAAGTLAVLIFIIAVRVIVVRHRRQSIPWVVPITLLFLVLFQAALGMWTVTLKLLPVVVMGHLLGGMLIFSLLCYFLLQISSLTIRSSLRARTWVGVGLVLVFCQIALGGWVSANYAGIACIGFPRCNGLWVPTLHFSQGFNLLSPVGVNYQGGQLENAARMTIQYVHRIGALISASYIILLSLWMVFCTAVSYLRMVGVLCICLVLLQVSLGIINVLYLLPLTVAVLHNGVAALLMASLFAMRYFVTGGGANAN